MSYESTDAESGIIIIFAVMVGFLSMVAVTANRQANEHEAVLKREGCHLLTTVPTGRKKYCGKACFTDERAYFYDCAGGVQKTEIR